MIDLTNIEEDTLEALTLYLCKEGIDNRESTCQYGSPFGWIASTYTIVGIREQVEEIKNSKPEDLKYKLREVLQRNCQWKNGKSPEKRIKTAMGIFTYLKMEEQFEEQLK